MSVRDEADGLPLHVFGIGHPDLVESLFEMGVASVDSSAFVKMADDGRLWASDKKFTDPSPTTRLHLALCNLAYATGKALPLSCSCLMFETASVRR